MDTSITVAVALGAFFVLAVVVYYRLVTLRNRVEDGLAQIDVQLKRRHDLIPDLVETARGYLAHERGTLEAVTAARDSARAAGQAALGAGRGSDPEAMTALARAEGALSSSLERLFALVEARPDLRADRNMMQLSEEITTAENKLSSARQVFNEAVMQFNTALEAFPAALFAGMLGFRRASPLAPLEADPERQTPAVRL
jgi:LemA protein